MYEELPREICLCKENLIATRESMVVAGGETKPKLVYMVECVLILHLFAVEHIPASGKNLIGFVRPNMLKWDSITKIRV